MIILCTLAADRAFALSWHGHVSVQNNYVWGLTTEAGRMIHSEIIDTVPWRPSGGGGNHRLLWGHSEEWFYKGQIPKAEALKNIKDNLKNLSGPQLEAEAQKVFREAVSKTGQERIAEALRSHAPSLTKKESMAAAEQLWAAHLVGDSETREGLFEALKQKCFTTVGSPFLEALSANNKLAITEAIRSQGESFSPAAFARQSQNFTRLKVEQYAQKGFKIYNPAYRNDIGITVDNVNYIIKDSWTDAAKALERNPSAKIFLPDDVYAKGVVRHPELAEKVVRESSVTGIKAPLAEQQENMTRIAAARQDEIRAAEDNRIAALKKQMRQDQNALKKLAPYALAGGLMALSENWEMLKDAWDGRAAWSKALTRTGLDFAGYTATPYLVDGVLTRLGGKSIIAASLKNAGLGYTLGFFIWNAGKEYLAYQLGDISDEYYKNRMKQRGAQAVREAAMIPVNMLVYKLIGSSGTFVVPAVIIGGSFAIQRIQQWYEDKQWRETITVEDAKAILGEDLMNEFTLLTPETRLNLADPERWATLAAPEERSSLIKPEERPNIIGY